MKHLTDWLTVLGAISAMYLAYSVIAGITEGVVRAAADVRRYRRGGKH